MHIQAWPREASSSCRGLLAVGVEAGKLSKETFTSNRAKV